jgi:hypothetical protein
MENLKLFVGSDQGMARKHTQAWLERLVSEQFMRSQGPRGHKWVIVKQEADSPISLLNSILIINIKVSHEYL